MVYVLPGGRTYVSSKLQVGLTPKVELLPPGLESVVSAAYCTIVYSYLLIAPFSLSALELLGRYHIHRQPSTLIFTFSQLPHKALSSTLSWRQHPQIQPPAK